MGNLLKNVKIAEDPKYEKILSHQPLIHEFHENIEALSKEFHNLKKNVNLENNPEELLYKIFKIRDLKNSLVFKKNQLNNTLHFDTTVTHEELLALDVLKSYAENLEMKLLEKYRALTS